MNKILVCLTLSFMSLGVQGQNKKKTPYFKRTNLEAGATLATNGGLSATAFNLTQYWGLGKKKKKFQIGLGARLTSSFGGSALIYQTAPAILTSGKTGPSVFFAEQITQNIDTLTLSGTQVNALNLLLALRYDISKKLGVEFNIDLLGFSIGGSKNGTLTYGDGTKNTKAISASPTIGNVLLISDNDLGSLNSELMAYYKFNKRVSFRGGISFLFNEYQVDNPVAYVNSKNTSINTDRYRTKALMFGLGISYKLQ